MTYLNIDDYYAPLKKMHCLVIGKDEEDVMETRSLFIRIVNELIACVATCNDQEQ